MTAPKPSNRDGYNSIPIPVDDAVESISAFRRRLVILFINEHDSALTIGKLAEAIASIETGQPMTQLSAQERKRIYIALYQHHLKTLHRTGAIIYEDRAKKVHETKATEGLAEIIRHLHWVCELH